LRPEGRHAGAWQGRKRRVTSPAAERLARRGPHGTAGGRIGATEPNFKARGGRHVPGKDEIEQKVKKIVADQMSVAESEISRDTHFVNDLNADSLDTVELVMEFEEAFEMNIPDEEAEKIQTIGQAIDYIDAHLSSNPASS
jgi:acyl carrier protein